MKILIITMNVGRTSPGIVFEKLIQGLSKGHEVDVLTSDYDPSIDLSAVRSIIEIKKKYLHPRVSEFLISLFHLDLGSWIWSKKVFSYLKANKHNDYNLIYCLVSFSHYGPLMTGVSYTKMNRAKLAVHMVDAIPAPLGWSQDNAYFKGLKKMMGFYLSKADFLFSINKPMLEYQLSTFKPKSNLVTEVIFIPISNRMTFYKYTDRENNMFLYTGGIYGVRTPKYVLAAFKEILEEFPNSTLEFVGSNIPEKYFSSYAAEERCKVIIHPFTRDLSTFYERATALIDIDADLPNDVFLSGKIINYIIANRIIISETGDNSPSREIFKGIPSILQCGHNSKEIAAAMKYSIRNRDSLDFNDRNQVIKLFSMESVISTLNKKLLKEAYLKEHASMK